MDAIISFKNKIDISSMMGEFSKKEYGIEQNPAQKAFMITNLHKHGHVKRSSSS